MSSWLSEEIVLARQNFEKEIQKAISEASATWQKEQLDVKKCQEDMYSKLEALKAAFENQNETAHKLEDESSSCIQRRLPNESPASPSPSVMEARAVIEDRKWRLKDLQENV